MNLYNYIRFKYKMTIRLNCKNRRAYSERVMRPVEEGEYEEWFKMRKWKLSRLYHLSKKGEITQEDKKRLVGLLMTSTLDTIDQIVISSKKRSKLKPIIELMI